MLSITCKTLSLCFPSRTFYNYYPRPHGANVHNPIQFIWWATVYFRSR